MLNSGFLWLQISIRMWGIDETLLRCSFVALVASVAGCYASNDSEGADTSMETERDTVVDTPATDASVDEVTDPGIDTAPDPEPDLVEDMPTDPMPEGRTGRLVPDTTSAAVYGPESGFDIIVHSGWILPAAFSGTVYEIIMDEQLTSGKITSLYQLDPGVDHLYTSWADSTVDAVGYGSICWTGSVFVAVLPTPGVGLRLLAVDESGTVVRPVEVLAASSEYVAGIGGDASFVFCPSSGPFVVDRFGGTKIFQLNRDGTVAGGPISTDLPTFGRNFWSTPCTEAGAEGVCAMESGILFVGRDGSYRHSDPLPGGAVACLSDCDVAYTGTYVALLYPSVTGGTVYATYALYTMDGALIVPPVTGDPVGTGPLGFHAASSGDMVLLIAEDVGGPGADVPKAHLMDLLGTPMDRPQLVPTWRGAAVSWEGDAYGVLWNTHPDMKVGYRRFLVED